MQLIAAMWPDHRFTVYQPGFSGWQVWQVRDGKPCIPCAAVAALPFVPVPGGQVVFQAVAKDGTLIGAYPTHMRALNAVRRCNGKHVTPVEFIGPLQPHIQRLRDAKYSLEGFMTMVARPTIDWQGRAK
jgi:hypothetical protein